MKRNIIFLSMLILLSCGDKVQPTDNDLIVGSWIDQSPAKLHFSLLADGTATSDNMATLLYKKWSVEDRQLILIVESIGNGISFTDTVKYGILKLDKTILILNEGDLNHEFKRKE